jgi:hypothetical protein
MNEIRYSSDLDLATVPCSVCGKLGLEEYLCFNCKGTLECVFCCGCEE